MSKIHLIVGGARSGKSAYAEQLASEISSKVLYLATAVVTDDDMANRIKRHQESRPAHWKTIEMYKSFARLERDKKFAASDVILLDCLTILMTNNMFDAPLNYDTATPLEIEQVENQIWEELLTLMEIIRKRDKTLIMVTNEVGMGLVPAYRLGNHFRDISGRMNRRVAEHADEVVFVAVGIPLKLKGGHN